MSDYLNGKMEGLNRAFDAHWGERMNRPDWIGLADKNMRETAAATVLNLGVAASEPVNEDRKMFSEGHEDKHPESPGASEGKPQS